MRVTRKVLSTSLAYGVTTVVGFLGTIYFARVLGPGPIGTFSLGVSIVIWGTVFDLGIGISAVKRISEGDRRPEFISASLLLYGCIVGVYALVLYLARGAVNAYVGADVAVLVILLFVGVMAYGGFTNVIKGLNEVHVKNWVDVLEQTLRVAAQVVLVVVGLEYLALFLGYIASAFVGLTVAALYLYTRTDVSLRVPSRLEFEKLIEFARFSWLSRLKSQSRSWLDVFVLGFFVTQSTVGIYQISWTVSRTFSLLPKAISSNLFPEASGLESGETSRVRKLVQEGLVYAGFVSIPGTIGALLLGRRVLGIYGQDFRAGYVVLVVLSAAVVVRGYEQLLLRIIDSLDRPDVTFRINSLFLVANVSLNVLLIWNFEAVGAAVATLVSTTVSLAYAWHGLDELLGIRFPGRAVAKQFAAALVMGALVVGLDRLDLLTHTPELFMLVGAGTASYVAIMIVISEGVREKTRSLAGV